MEREAQIVEVMSGVPPNTPSPGSRAWKIWDIVSVIYKDYPKELWLPAAHGVGLHLKKLEKEERAKYLGGEGVEQSWVLTAKL